MIYILNVDCEFKIIVNVKNETVKIEKKFYIVKIYVYLPGRHFIKN